MVCARKNQENSISLISSYTFLEYKTTCNMYCGVVSACEGGVISTINRINRNSNVYISCMPIIYLLYSRKYWWGLKLIWRQGLKSLLQQYRWISTWPLMDHQLNFILMSTARPTTFHGESTLRINLCISEISVHKDGSLKKIISSSAMVILYGFIVWQ